MKKFLILTIVAFLTVIAANAATQDKNSVMKDSTTSETRVLLHTDLGDIIVRLYDDTPLHRDNFLKLVSQGYYDGVLFHRVIKDFMVQTGDPESKGAPQGKHLGAGDPGYTIPSEINYPKHFHKYGALAAARTGDQVNPERRSSGSQFYIVTGNKYSERDMQRLEQNANNSARQNYFNKLRLENKDKIRELQMSRDSVGLEDLRLRLIEQTEKDVPETQLPVEVVEAYTSIGGTPHLDGQYTVFGEVIDGMDVVEKIQNTRTASGDRPVEDIHIISATLLDKNHN